MKDRFLIEEDGEEAELVYRLEGSTMTLVHTGVPDALGGRGIGGRLVRQALERARAEGLALRPECPFARSWLEKHPDEVGAVEVDWPT